MSLDKLRTLVRFSKPASSSQDVDAAEPKDLPPINDEWTRSIRFREFCLFLRRLAEPKHTRLQKEDWLEKAFNEWRLLDRNLYPIIRLLLPQEDRERGNYNLKEKGIGRVYIELLNLARKSTDAHDLLNHRVPVAPAHKPIGGDFAKIAHAVISNRVATVPVHMMLTIKDINDLLNALAAASNEKERREVFRVIYTRSTAEEQYWFIRIVLKDLKVGLTERTVLKKYHVNAFERYEVNTNLRRVCTELSDPAYRIPSQEIRVLEAFRPMKAANCELEDLTKHMGQEEFIIETKLDGERLLVHRKDDQWKLYSRNSTDQTLQYGETGGLLNVIKGQLDPRISEVVLDGEVLAYDPEMDEFKDFGTVKRIANTGNMEPDKEHLCYVVFDVLYIRHCENPAWGGCLMDEPWSTRQAVLREIVQEQKNYFEIIDRTTGRTEADIIHAIEETIRVKGEGVVVKNPRSKYCLGKKDPEKWIKVKPETMRTHASDVDVLLLGACYGQGSRGNKISQMICGVVGAGEGSIVEGKPAKFDAFVRVGTGLSNRDRHNLFEQLRPYTHPYNPRNPPSGLNFGKQKPDIWFEPDKSVMLTVKAAEFIQSNEFATDHTLRFPRLMRIRDDKSWDECMNSGELATMRRDGLKRKIEGEERESNKKRRKTTTTVSRRPTNMVPAQFQITQKLKPEIGNMFEGLTFCVMLDSPLKEEIEGLILQYKGKVAAIPSNETAYIVADLEKKKPQEKPVLKVRVQNVINSSMVDIDVIRPKWIQECHRQSDLITPIKSDMIHCSKKMEEFLKLHSDVYGDSYTEDVTEESLLEIFQEMKVPAVDPKGRLFWQLKDAMLARYFNEQLPAAFMLHGVTAYVDGYLQVGDPSTAIPNSEMEIASLLLRAYGATVETTLTEKITHIVVAQDRDERTGRIVAPRWDELFAPFRGKKLYPSFVTIDWVMQSAMQGYRLSEASFLARK